MADAEVRFAVGNVQPHPWPTIRRRSPSGWQSAQAAFPVRGSNGFPGVL